MPTKYDWTQFSLYRYYHAPLEQVWNAWATSAGMCSFFIEECVVHRADGSLRDQVEQFETGDTYLWRWRHDYSLEGRLLEIAPKELLSFSFGDMKVELQFLDTGSGIRVHLHQSDISDSDEGKSMGHMNCRSCWILFLTNLVSILANGRDLRDDNPNRVSSMEVGFVPPE